jgi:hypothetical protein
MLALPLPSLGQHAWAQYRLLAAQQEAAGERGQRGIAD